MEIAKSIIIFDIIIIAILCFAILITALFIWIDKQDKKYNIHRCQSCIHFVPKLFKGYCCLKGERMDSEHLSCDDFSNE